MTAPAVTTTRYVVPRVHGDPAAVRRLAGAYRALATTTHEAQQRVAAVTAAVSQTWRGAGQRASSLPVEAALSNLAALVRVLDEVADQLDSYAHKLEQAQQHHGFSLRKLVAIGAVVVVSTAAIVVTVGVAGAVEAAAAGAAVAGATEAAGAASAAALATGSVLESLDVLAALRPLLAFALPHLVSVEWSAGAVAAYQEATADRLDWHELAVTGGMSFLGSAAAGRLAGSLADWSGLARAAAPVRFAVPHVAEGGVWAGVSAADDELLQGRIDGMGVAESFVLAGSGTAGRDALRERGIVFTDRDYYRLALAAELRRPGRIADPRVAHDMAVLRQRPRELERGEVDLPLHEGPGHTLRRHVGRDAVWLRQRARRERRRLTSSYFDPQTAEEAARRAIRANLGAFRGWLRSGSTDAFRARITAGHDLGYVLDRHGTVRFTRDAVVVVRRDHYGVYVVTSFPDLPARRGR